MKTLFTRRRYVHALFHVAFALFALTSQAEKPSSAPPNIVVFVADDVGMQDIGCYGNTAVQTPNVNALAGQGMVFSKAFLTTPQCSPTRTSVLAGKYAHTLGTEDLHAPLPNGEKIVPGYLKECGYFTGHMLKTHYGPNGIRQFDWYSDKKEDFGRFLDTRGHKPFFVWVGLKEGHRPFTEKFTPPHQPSKIQVPPYMPDTPEVRGDLAQFYDEIGVMDAAIGNMITELKKRMLLESTLLVFFGDNGQPFPRAKGSLYDSGIATPLICSWPGHIRPGSVHTGLVSVIDLAPTFLDLAGVSKPKELPGRSLAPVFKNPNLPGRTCVFSERNWHDTDEHLRSVRTDQFKLIRVAYTNRPYGNTGDGGASPSLQSMLKLREEGKLTPAQARLFQVPRPALELYDVQKDPWELNNLASDPAYSETIKNLSKLLDQWYKESRDFPPERRQRDDIADRVTGKMFRKGPVKVPPLKE